MSSPVNAQLNGVFDTPATLTRTYISLPPGYTQFKIFNETDIAAVGAGINAAEGKATFPAHYSITYTGAALVPAIVNNAGFTFVADSGDQTPTAPIAVTAITAASPAVVSSASPAMVGDVIRLSNTTGMLQVGGWDFSVSATNPGVTQSLNNLIAAGFGAAATAGFVRIIPFFPRFYPPTRRIVAIATGLTTVIALNVTHFYTVGQRVKIVVPQGWGMPEINGLYATIVAVGTALSTSVNTITVDIDSTGFTAFAFPTSAIAALGTSVPEIIPVGETAHSPWQNLLDDATRNISFTGVMIDPGVLVASKHYSWVAYKGTTITPFLPFP